MLIRATINQFKYSSVACRPQKRKKKMDFSSSCYFTGSVMMTEIIKMNRKKRNKRKSSTPTKQKINGNDVQQ